MIDNKFKNKNIKMIFLRAAEYFDIPIIKIDTDTLGYYFLLPIEKSKAL